jgi:AcrR family transcriptional regulator
LDDRSIKLCHDGRVSSSRANRRPRPRRTNVLPHPPHPPKGAEITAEKLLEAAHELLDETSGAEPSVSQICERADVRVAMVSYCFGGKTQLLEALFDRIISGIMAEQDALAARDLPPEEALAVQIEATVRNLVRYPYVHSLGPRLAAGDRAVVRMSETFVRPTQELYRRLIEKGVEAGTFRPVDPTLLVFSVVGMCDFLFVARDWLTDVGQTLDDELIDRVVQHTVRLVLHGVAPES